MKQLTNIKIKGKDGTDIPVVIDDQPKLGGPYMEAVEKGVLSRINKIVAEAILTRDVRAIDPNDPMGEGKLIAKAGAVTHEQIAAMQAALEGVWSRIGDDLILPPMSDALGFMRRANADLITNQMRTEMLNVAAKTLDEMSPEDSAPLSAWINDSRIENFREWLLSKGGWDKAIVERRPLQDELGRCFAGMPAGAVPNVDLSNIKGDELTEWPIKYRAIHLAGSRTAPVEEAMRPLIEGEPLKYLDALRRAFEGQLWEVLLKTADKDERDELGKAVPVEDSFAWLRMMVRPYVEEQAEGMRDRRSSSLSILIRPKATTEDGDEFTAFPRILSIASLMGGQFSIQANGENYFEEPNLAAKAASVANQAMRQRSVEIVPTEWIRSQNEQFTLALDLDVAGSYLRDPFGGPLELATRTATMARMPNIALKMFPVLFAIAPLSGRMVKGKRIELARLVYPDWATGEGAQILPWKKRRQQRKDLETITTGFICAGRGLQMREIKPDGTRHPYDLFTIDYDLSTEPDADTGWMVNPWLSERMRGGTAGGFFLLNMTRWLTLGISNPRLFTLALRLNAIFDEHRVGGLYERNRVKPIRCDELARQCNMLPMTVEGRSDETIKARLRQARATMESDLNALHDVGLLGPWAKTKKKVHGQGFEFLPLAPEDYAGACERANLAVRKNQERKAKKKGRQG
jgi:hypothetical protein